MEESFEKLKGVTEVISGYSGGTTENPTYEEVCAEQTEHAEVVQIHFDPNKISYDNLLEIFFYTHDPTTLNRQGADIGSQYRSIILYHNIEQKNIAEKYISKDDGTEVHVSKCPECEGKIKSPTCCGADMAPVG